MFENEISYGIRGAAFKVHSILGPGLLESVYEAALIYELTKAGYEVKTQIGIPVIYDSQDLGLGFRLDIIVNDAVIIEVKSIEALAPVHYKQLLTYLRLSDKKLGLLINFNSVLVKDGMKRVVNGLKEAA
jgi:GxxExxY protein